MTQVKTASLLLSSKLSGGTLEGGVEVLKCRCYGAEAPSSRQRGHDNANTRWLFTCFSLSCFLFSGCFQAVEELLESLELEKSSYHMGLSKVSTAGPPGASEPPGPWCAGAVPPGVVGGRCCAAAGRVKGQISQAC